jgi:hypothetical protein
LKRIIAASLVVALIALAGGLIWSISAKDSTEERLNAASDKVDRLSDSLDAAQKELEEIRGSLDSNEKDVKHQRGRIEDLRNGKSGLRIRLGQLRGLTGTFIPQDAHLRSSTLAAGSDLLVVSWWKGRTDSYPRTSGVYMWKRDPENAPMSWRRVYGVTLDNGRDVAIGPPGAESSEDTSIGEYALTAGVEDVTGDGSADVLTLETNSGSGGCGIWRVFEATRTSFRQIFRREHCEHPIAFHKGLLRIDSAIYGKDCDSIHGCGTRRTWLRWDGNEWNKVRTRVISRD